MQGVKGFLVGSVVRLQDKPHCSFLHLLKMAVLGEVEGACPSWGSILELWEHERGVDVHHFRWQSPLLFEPKRVEAVCGLLDKRARVLVPLDLIVDGEAQ